MDLKKISELFEWYNITKATLSVHICKKLSNSSHSHSKNPRNPHRCILNFPHESASVTNKLLSKFSPPPHRGKHFIILITRIIRRITNKKQPVSGHPLRYRPLDHCILRIPHFRLQTNPLILLSDLISPPSHNQTKELDDEMHLRESIGWHAIDGTKIMQQKRLQMRDMPWTDQLQDAW